MRYLRLYILRRNCFHRPLFGTPQIPPKWKARWWMRQSLKEFYHLSCMCALELFNAAEKGKSKNGWLPGFMTVGGGRSVAISETLGFSRFSHWEGQKFRDNVSGCDTRGKPCNPTTYGLVYPSLHHCAASTPEDITFNATPNLRCLLDYSPMFRVAVELRRKRAELELRFQSVYASAKVCAS